MRANGILRYAELAMRECPDAILLSTCSGEVLYWNDGARTVLGYSSAEAVGRNISELIVPPELLGQEQLLLARTIETGAVTAEALRRKQDGTLVYVDISCKLVPGSDGNPACIVSTYRDVTTLRVLRDSKQVETRFKALLESTPDGIVMVNPTGHIVFANSHAERLFGYASGELRSKPIEVLLPDRLHGAHLGQRSKYFGDPRARAMGAGLELFGRSRDGSEFPVEVSLSPLQMDETSLVISAIRDISDRRHIEQELREKNLALENASLAKDRFLASMSHELRTPLNAIIGFTGTLLMKLPGPLNEDQESQLGTVQSSSRHLLSLINDLLDVARIDADKMVLHAEPVDLKQLIDELAVTLLPQAELKGLRLLLTVPTDTVEVTTDRRALSQILLNLTDNAVKFTERGTVNIRLQGPLPATGELIVSVEDTGSGIRQADQRQLFEAFSRFETVPGQITSGTGLGLHLSRKLANQLGGTLTCKSEFGKGSLFSLRLPAS